MMHGKYRKNFEVYGVDPLSCPSCGGEMRIISFITELPVIRKILKHLGSQPDV
jgi:C4-type Zn-finger protein